MKGKPANVAATAAAHEMACFIWGMMTNNIPEKTYIGERNKFFISNSAKSSRNRMTRISYL